MNEKKISVIIPCYNAEVYIQRCLNSLLCQTMGFDALEIIFVDDCSEDKTFELLSAFEAKHEDCVLLVRLDRNSRQGAARNAGMQYASGKYIAFIDADDWVTPDYLEILYKNAELYECELTECRYKKVEEYKEPGFAKGVKVTCKELGNKKDKCAFLVENIAKTAVWACLFKREFLMESNLYFPENIRFEDGFFTQLMKLYVNHYCCVETELYYYYENRQSTIHKPDSSHHYERLDVQELYLEECRNRGFLREFESEIEYTFILKYYMEMMDVFMRRFSNIPMEKVMEIRKRVRVIFPGYKENPYLKKTAEENAYFREVLALL